MKHILFYFILFYFILSCKEKKTTVNKIDSSIEIKDTLKSNPNFTIKVKKDIVEENEFHFIDRLKQIKKEKLPYKFHSYLIDSLHNEVDFSNSLHKLLTVSFDSISNVNPIYKTTINILNKHEEFDKYKFHYSLLFDKGKDDKCCVFSKEVVFKKLGEIGNSKSSFLTITRFKGQRENHFLGLIINLVVYDLKNNKEIDKKAISMLGYGYENSEYYEGFITYKDSIVVKGYVYLESELPIINKRFYISETGMIKSSYDIEVIDFE